MVTLKPPAIAVPGIRSPFPSIFTSGLIIICTGFDAKRSIIVEQVSHGGCVFEYDGIVSCDDA